MPVTKAGQDLVIEIETGAISGGIECFMSFIQKDTTPTILNGEHLAQSQFFEDETYTSLRLSQVEAGTYFLFVQKLIKKPLAFVKGGGDFKLTYYFEALA